MTKILLRFDDFSNFEFSNLDTGDKEKKEGGRYTIFFFFFKNVTYIFLTYFNVPLSTLTFQKFENQLAQLKI